MLFFTVTRRFRRLFEAGECLLVPTARIIEVYHANRAIPVGADFPDVPVCTPLRA